MTDATPRNALLAQGIQFQVLARAFPVLRHDAVKPISNAKLATAMMQRGDDGADPSAERSQQLLADVDAMLDEGVIAVRELADWLTPTSHSVSIAVLLHECAKLLFTELLLSGKKIVVEDGESCPRVSMYSGRYVVLCWILHMVEAAPDGSELRIACVSDTEVRARVTPDAGATVIRPTDVGPIAFGLPTCGILTEYYGWNVRGEGHDWTLTLPSVGNNG